MYRELDYKEDPVHLNRKQCPHHDFVPSTHYPELREACQEVIEKEVPILLEKASAKFLNKLDPTIYPKRDYITSKWLSVICPLITEVASGGRLTVAEDLSARLLLEYNNFYKEPKCRDWNEKEKDERLEKLLRDDWKPIIAEGGILNSVPGKLSDILPSFYGRTLSHTLKIFESDSIKKALVGKFFANFKGEEIDKRVSCLVAGVTRGTIIATSLNYALLTNNQAHRVSLVDSSNRLKTTHELLEEFSEVISLL